MRLQVKRQSKISFSFLTIFAITAVSMFAIYSIHKTQKKVLLLDEIDWDI